ncbi:SRPBCC family protein [Streptomyces sp. NPDC050658]|uniref:aromatase/cyclase n=1 Tax=unclassified Streptomyces TaxID=2593676 RepID=UPI0034221BCF
MSGERVRRLSHAAEVDAPAGVVYQLVADAERWPLYFPPNVHVERLDFDGVRERLRIWSVAEGQVKSWTSQRVQDAARRTVSFDQDRTVEEAASMGGTWHVTELGPARCRLTVEHVFTAADGRPQDEAWLERAAIANARSDLKSVRFLAERWARLDELVLSFEESLRVKGPAELVYGFLYDVADWPGQVPGVLAADLHEPQVGVQHAALDLAGADGTVQQVSSVRVCFPHAGRIVFKQTRPGDLLAAHCGEYSVLPDQSGVTVLVQHHAVLREKDIERVLGAGATLADARRKVRADLGHQSRQTLQVACRHAESAVRVL